MVTSTSSKAAITANSQVTRFHIDTLTPDTREVDLKQVYLSIGDTELLLDAHLRLKEGVHYGLVGRNGVGKSALLRAIGERLMVGFPANIRVLYVEQEITASDLSVLQAVLAADKQKFQLKADVSALEHALSGSLQIQDVVLDIHTRMAQEQSAKKGSIADKRSGRRGQDARKSYIKAEQQARQTKTKKLGVEEATLAANQLLTDFYQQLGEVDADADEARAISILKGLGFSDTMLQGPTSALSGGWRMRCALATALFQQPDMLLLDEPTNHLDLKAVLWLMEWLKGCCEQTIVVVSHDRHFLNEVAEEIILYKDQQLQYYPGNFDTFQEAREEHSRWKNTLAEVVEKKKKAVQASINNALKAARESGDDKKLGMVASRRKKLERMGMEKTEDGKRFKVSYFAGYHNSVRAEVETVKAEKEVVFDFPEPESLRYNGPILQLRDVSFRYSPAGPDVLQHVVLDINMESRVGLVGLNGSGKSTLMGIISGTLTPTQGTVERYAKLKVGFFSQHNVDELNLEQTPLARLMAQAPTAKEQEMRNYLGSFGIQGRTATQPLHTLSGGQKARVALASVLWEQPHILLLDEPTNHLDYLSIQALSLAIARFGGGVVVVSHDIRFLEETCDEMWLVSKGVLKEMDSLEQYVERMVQRVRRQLQAG